MPRVGPLISESQTEPILDTPASVETPKVSGFEFQPDPEIPKTGSCSINDLLRYHDRSFVQHAYAVIARRRPTPAELSKTLGDLREGARSKVEIIEALVATENANGANVVVRGLPSPTLRKLSRWPVVGYVFRLIRAITRLPLLMQDQQRFESYSLAQQQRLADFVNETIVPAVSARTGGGDLTELQTTLADAVESVMMLSDAMIDLAGKQTQLSEKLDQYRETNSQLSNLQTQLAAVENAQRELQSNVESSSREMQLSLEKIAREPQQLQDEIKKVQQQREQSESVLHQDILRLTEALQVLQKQFADLNIWTTENVAAQREFLVQEQQLIVEAQKVAVKELELQIGDLQRTLNEKTGHTVEHSSDERILHDLPE